ncbi:MAG: AAA family ATPase [Alphaproteobacteria bacterium]|nr:MoxR family ATPase [Alphaproteobacteria bacterium]MDY4689561.1 MoxR family ATPase [Alphaproteobacteria bacterium]
MSEIRDKITNLKQFMESRILGQEALVRKLIISMLADGHVLVEGAPGLAKTKAIKTLAECIDALYSRIQFTPDLLPSDITGSDIYVASTGQFEFRKGPIFANLVLADEINRAPAKVQSALLESMAERQVSVGGKLYKLPKLFMVMATQNPIEHEGTYNLPEAQLDRFLMYIKIDQPDAVTERKILQLVRNEDNNTQTSADSLAQFKVKFGALKYEDIFSARQEAYKIHCSDAVEEYLIQLIMATRHPERYDESLKNTIAYGASPRATIALDKCSKINAWLAGRDFVTPEDVHAVVYDVLRHRVILSFEAQAGGLSSDEVIARLLKVVPLP